MIPPPEIFLQTAPPQECQTDLIDCYFDLAEMMMQCNADKKSITDFYKEGDE